MRKPAGQTALALSRGPQLLSADWAAALLRGYQNFDSGENAGRRTVN